MRYKLTCFDMGGVLIEDRNFWMTLHKKYRTLEEGQELTDKYLMTDYARLVEEVPGGLWKGKNAKNFYNLVYNTRMTKGIDNLFAYLTESDVITAIISASELEIARRIQETCGIEHLYANHLVIKNDKVDGDFWWPIGASGVNKLNIMENLAQSLAIPMEEVIYVGNDDIDKECLSVAGFPIAFNAKPHLNELVESRGGHVQQKPNLECLIRPIIDRET